MVAAPYVQPTVSSTVGKIRELGLVGLALYLVDWPTIVLQCLTLLVGSSDT